MNGSNATGSKRLLRRGATRRVTILLMALGAAISGCSSGESDTTTPTTPATTTTATATPATTTTVEPATTTTPTTAIPESNEEPLVLVVFGDSVVTFSTTLVDAYTSSFEKEFGVPVDVRDRAVWGSSPSALLNNLRNSETIQADLMEADAVLLEIPQGDVNPAFPTAIGWRGMDPADCGGDDHQQCLRDYVTGNKASVEAILFELTAICDPSKTLIRALDVYMLEVEDTNALGKLHILTPYLQETQEYLEVTAAQHGIPVAQVYDAFMGPDGTNDPQDGGLVMSDARHPTEAGSLLIAQMLHDLGYDLAS